MGPVIEQLRGDHVSSRLARRGLLAPGARAEWRFDLRRAPSDDVIIEAGRRLRADEQDDEPRVAGRGGLMLSATAIEEGAVPLPEVLQLSQ